MARIEVGGIGIAYALVGERRAGGRTIAITPGGRSSKDTPGVRPLADALAAAGHQVLIWDRPNTGASDLCFAGETESIQNADALAGLLRALGLAPALLVGGSGGARDSLLTAVRHPDAVSGLFLLWLTGGAVGLVGTAYFYTHDAAFAAATGGMAGVAALPAFAEPLERGPGNRERLLAHDPAAFVSVMQRWAGAFLPAPGAPMAGVTADQLAALDVPAVVLRSGAADIHHARATSEAVAAALPGATLAEPPWGDAEWLDRMAAQGRGEGLFARWPLLSQQILDFATAGMGGDQEGRP